MDREPVVRVEVVAQLAAGEEEGLVAEAALVPGLSGVLPGVGLSVGQPLAVVVGVDVALELLSVDIETADWTLVLAHIGVVIREHPVARVLSVFFEIVLVGFLIIALEVLGRLDGHLEIIERLRPPVFLSPGERLLWTDLRLPLSLDQTILILTFFQDIF